MNKMHEVKTIEAKARLTDHYGILLIDGLYFASDGLEGSLYFVKLSKDKRSFSVHGIEGDYIPITNYTCIARQLVRVKPNYTFEPKLANTGDFGVF